MQINILQLWTSCGEVFLGIVKVFNLRLKTSLRLAWTQLAARLKPKGASSPISHSSQSGRVYKFVSRGQFFVISH